MVTNRRQFLKGGAAALGTFLFLGKGTKAIAAACGLTPPQTSGPFYPGETQFHPDNDLTFIPGHSQKAEGKVVYIKGRVLDSKCNPVANANVEIWQACASGRYNNPKDTNPAPLDRNFKFWGEAFTNADGEYDFKTIIPGAYPADTGWTRPPHIHFKVSRLGYKELTTQMYFAGNALNDSDLILRDIPSTERGSVVVNFQPSPVGFDPGSLIGTFDLTIQSVR